MDGGHIESATGNAIVDLNNSSAGGPATGVSEHVIKDGEAPPLYLSGDAGTRPVAPPCEDPPPPDDEHGADYYWDPEFQKCIPLYCPLMIAVGTDQVYTLTSPQLGVAFDIDANGTLDQIAWTEPNEEIAFLALDRNGDGTINDGRELFGDHTVPGVKNGFDALRRMTMETNGGIARGEVGSDDPIFARLLLWTDRNHNGLSEAGELRPAADVVSRIGLGYTPFDRRDGNGNRFRFRGFVYVRTAPGVNLPSSYRENKGRTRSIYDVFLRVQP